MLLTLVYDHDTSIKAQKNTLIISMISQNNTVLTWIMMGHGIQYNWVWEHVAKTVRDHLKSKNKIKLLTVKQQQQIIRKLCKDWTSYWELWKLYKTGELKDAPNIPHYKENFNGIDFTNQMINKSLVQKGVFKLSGLSQGFLIPEYLDKNSVKSGRLVVNNSKSFTVELLYEVENVYTVPEEVPVIPELSLIHI